MPKKVDANQRIIVKALRDMGATVQHLHTIGKGCPDLLVGWRNVNYVLEVKSGKEPLTDDEDCWHTAWRGCVDVVRTPQEAIELLLGGE